MSSRFMAAGAAAMLAAAHPALAETGIAKVTTVQRATLATFASAGCLMRAVSRTYSSAESTDDIAAEAEKACDREALEVPRAQAAAGVPDVKTDAASARAAALALAKVFADQVRNASTAPQVTP